MPESASPDSVNSVSPPQPLPSTAAVDLVPPTEPDNTLAGPSIPLERRVSRLARLTLVRSTDAHPPHHAHFDVPEGQRDSGDITPTPSVHHEPHHRSGSAGPVEKGSRKPKPLIDIEHVPVEDDPRDWSDGKKNFVLALLTVSVVCATLAVANLDRVRKLTRT